MQVGVDEVVQLGSKLHAGRAAADNYEVQQLRPRLRVDAGPAGAFELLDDALPDGARVGQVAQEQTVLMDSRHTERVVARTYSDDEMVVAQVEAIPVAHGLALDVPRLGFDGLAGRLIIGELPHRANRLDDAAELHRAHGRAGQQRREQEVVARADHGDVEVFAIEPSHHLHGPEAGAQDHDARLVRCAQRAQVST